ncbi:hypothetical protein KVR01_009600 [Diaporthe batatas]|uniref:uncharacterized protein n=1 Tax=Diaporthe batatas TaxID=748121 RepID=UPI001D04D3F2|nr:uncharacterized protein KVR01_009600 [Diaporthe batatas]KAG8161336.1 hypothetical protein KVR01_009600 [Diaporthe batatas]
MLLFSSILALLALPHTVLAGLQLDYADVPAACVTTCRAIAELSGICDVDADFDDNNAQLEDLMKLQCICTNASFDVPVATALCASCIDQNGMPSDRDDNMDDIGEIMARCGFQNLTWTPDVAVGAVPGVVDVYVSATRLISPAQITTSVDFAPPPPTATPSQGAQGQGEEGKGEEGKNEQCQGKQGMAPKKHKWLHSGWW